MDPASKSPGDLHKIVKDRPEALEHSGGSNYNV
jgi:hypothetical protein